MGVWAILTAGSIIIRDHTESFWSICVRCHRVSLFFLFEKKKPSCLGDNFCSPLPPPPGTCSSWPDQHWKLFRENITKAYSKAPEATYSKITAEAGKNANALELDDETEVIEKSHPVTAPSLLSLLSRHCTVSTPPPDPQCNTPLNDGTLTAPSGKEHSNFLSGRASPNGR